MRVYITLGSPLTQPPRLFSRASTILSRDVPCHSRLSVQWTMRRYVLNGEFTLCRLRSLLLCRMWESSLRYITTGTGGSVIRAAIIVQSGHSSGGVKRPRNQTPTPRPPSPRSNPTSTYSESHVGHENNVGGIKSRCHSSVDRVSDLEREFTFEPSPNLQISRPSSLTTYFIM